MALRRVLLSIEFAGLPAGDLDPKTVFLIPLLEAQFSFICLCRLKNLFDILLGY